MERVDFCVSLECNPQGAESVTSCMGFAITEMRKEAVISGMLHFPLNEHDESEELDSIISDIEEDGWNIDEVFFPDRATASRQSQTTNP
jgi:hypothetical protein